MLNKKYEHFPKLILILGIIVNILYFLSLRLKFLDALFWDSQFTYGKGADLFAYYQAGYNVLHRISPYIIIEEYFVVPYCYPYMYLPFFAFSFGVIINIFNPWTAYIFWIFIIEVSLIFISYITYKVSIYFQMPKYMNYLSASIWFLFSPVYLDLYLGQINLIIAIFIFLSILLLETKYIYLSSISWIISCSSKPISYFFAPIYTVNKYNKSVFWNLFFTISSNLFFFKIIKFPANSNPIFQPSSFILYHGDLSFKSFICSVFKLYKYGTTNSILITIILIGIFLAFCFYITIISKDIWLVFVIYANSYYLITTRAWELHYNILIPFIILFLFRTIMLKKNLNEEIKILNLRYYIKKYSFTIGIILYILLAIPTPISIFNLIFHTNSVDDWPYIFIVIYHGSKCIPALLLFFLAFYLALEYRRAYSFKECFRICIKNVFNFKKIKMKKGFIKFGILID